MAARLYAVAFVNSFNIFSCSYECQEAVGPLWQPDCMLLHLLIVLTYSLVAMSARKLLVLYGSQTAVAFVNSFNIFSCSYECQEAVGPLWQPDFMLLHLLIVSAYSLVAMSARKLLVLYGSQTVCCCIC